MGDAGIIRNKLKINAAINNAGCVLEIQKEYGSFDRFIWAYVDFSPIVNDRKELKDIPAKTELSDRISKDLKKRGFKFVGRPSSTPLCRRSAWWMTIYRAVSGKRRPTFADP